MNISDFISMRTICNSEFGNDIYNQIKQLTLNKILYKQNISALAKELNSGSVRTIFKNLPLEVTNKDPFKSLCDSIPRGNRYFDITFCKKTPIIICADSRFDPTFILYTLNNNKAKRVLRCFVNKLRNQSELVFSNVNDIFANICCGQAIYFRGRSKRTFENVFLSQSVKEDILQNVNKFINNKEWYSKHNLPRHFGIMLYGPPGTGKSSIISALANELGLIPYFLKATATYELLSQKDYFREYFSRMSRPAMIIIEDIDSVCYLKKDYHKRPIHSENTDDYDEMEYDRGSDSLSDFLNTIDGSSCLENVIWVFTTNHIDKLIPSLVRAGRVDKKYLIDYVTDETFSEFIKYHFNEDVSVQIKDNVSFAEVQTDVMSGMTAKEIVEKYRI